jgi:hypothetical protein
MAGQHDAIARLAASHAARDRFALVLALLVAVALALSTAQVLRTLLPRATTTAATRFGWPSLVDANVDDLVGADPAGERRETWQHAHDLASIAAAKYRAVVWAIRWFILAGTLLLVWAFLAG